MINKPIVVFMVVLLVGMTAVGTVFAAGQRDSGVSEEQTYLFKYGNQQPEDHSRTVSMLWFAEELQRRSNGRIEVEVYHSGVLGTEREMFEMTVTGALQGYRGAFYEQLNPQFNLYNLPFLFQNYDELIHFNASDMARDMLERGSVQGIYMPAVGFTGLRALATTTGLIREPADLRGLQVRSPGQAPILEFYRHFRAVPQEIPWGDVYMAVRQRVVDGGDNAPTNLLAARLYEVAPYVTALNYMAGADPFMVNMDNATTTPSNTDLVCIKKVTININIAKIVSDQIFGF